MKLVRVLRLMVAALSAGAIAADAPPPTAPPAPPVAAAAVAPAPAQPDPATIPAQPLDEATVHRAERAADAYLKSLEAASIHPDPQAEHDLAEAEVSLLEAKTYLDQSLPLKAGEEYLLATKKLAGIAPEQRIALGQRLRKATASLTELSRLLLAEPAFNLGAPGSEKNEGAH